MSEYIEDRISSLENRVSDIERHYNGLHIRVNDLEDTVEDLKEQTNILADDYKIFRSEDYTDQSTEEFVKVVKCNECKYADTLYAKCKHPDRFNNPISVSGYCDRGEKK